MRRHAGWFYFFVFRTCHCRHQITEECQYCQFSFRLIEPKTELTELIRFNSSKFLPTTTNKSGNIDEIHRKLCYFGLSGNLIMSEKGGILYNVQNVLQQDYRGVNVRYILLLYVEWSSS